MDQKLPIKLESPTSVILTFIITAFLIILGGISLHRNFENILYHQKKVEHSQQVQREVDRMFIALRDAEASVRGYLLTGTQDYLAPFKQNRQDLANHYEKAVELTSDNATQTALLESMRSDIENRYKLFDDMISRFAETRAIYANDKALHEGRVMTSRMRNVVAQIQANEEALLQERQGSVRDSRRYFIIVLIGSTLLSFVAVSIAFRQWQKNQTKAITETRRAMIESNRKENLAETAKKVSGDLSLKNVGSGVLPHLAASTGALVGTFYVQKGDELHLVAEYGNLSAAMADQRERVRIGKGLLGEAYRRGQFAIHADLPSDYLRITSSTGETDANSIVLLPLYFQNFLVGIIELGYIRKVPEEQIEFLKEAGGIIGTGVNAAVTREQTQELLEKTQQQAEELEAQQEELRTNNEELEQQARALETQHEVMNQRNFELEEIRREVERKARDLESTSRYKSEFLAKMSHELRTPLNSLLILATLLTENKGGNLTAKQVGFSNSIRNAGNDLLNLINDILDLSKIEAQKITIRREPIKIGDFYDHIQSVFANQAEASGLKLNIQVPDKVKATEVFTDRQRLEQILKNFVSNALKFTPSGSITLSAIDLGDKIRFQVEDTGIGIPADKQDAIFEAFEQVDNSLSRSFSGTGLGLTISRELAHLLGGSIAMESQELKGSTFMLTLPKKAAGPAVETVDAKNPSKQPDFEPMPAHSTTQNIDLGHFEPAVTSALKNVKPDKKSILIVEDDERFRKLVVEAAASYNFETIEAGDGELALAILEKHQPDAVLLDIKLPGVSGLGLLEMMKRSPHLRHIPIHMISALEYQQSAMRIGAMGYLTKPVTIDKVRSALTRIENIISQRVKKLLVVEDDENQQKAIRHLVEGSDIEIVQAKNGAEALAAIEANPIDCIILDMSLPDMTGIDFLDHLTRLQVSVPPIVVYTGRDLSSDELRKLEKFSDSIIIKGAKSPDRLLDEVNLFLHRVEKLLPESKREMLAQMRGQNQQFDGSRVLIVDDDLRNVFALTSALEEKGFVIDVARNGAEAVEKVTSSEDKYDVVLMDIMMPVMDGLEATKKIRQDSRFRNLPIVALTAKAMKGDHEACIAAGCSDYLPKPVNLNNLFSVLKVWVQTGNYI